ncbi:MAG TPA: long-chain fatty acid--CoA ligase [Burkholderiales bacterium]|nr:long-chain fatty acid--CoA ligase [Burkholderiales bacterium]
MNLSRIVEYWARHAPARVALHVEGEDWTYARLWRRIVEAAGALEVAKGDRIAWLGFNDPEMLVLLLAAARRGALLVPLNWRLTAAEHRDILADCTPRWMFADAEHVEAARALGVPMGRLDAAAGIETQGEDDDELLIVYTSGTTGRPKGAVLTQSALLWNGYNSIHAHDLGQADHVLSTLPMFHVGGLNNQTLPALLAGATVTLHRRFEPGRWLADVAARRPSLSLLVPATMQAVISHPEWPRTDLSSLRLVYTGSMVVPDSLIRVFHARGVPVGQIYGSTETSPIAIVLTREDASRKVGSTGKAAAHCEVKLLEGEICVRGPNVMRRYWNDPAATAAALDGDGWFHSGDLARVDEEGFYWIMGRSKDVIISGGENIYPAELENVLADCPAIAESAVVGMPDAKWGETACAVVVRREGATLDEPSVLALFRDRLARYKHPRRVVFADALPKNALGKVQKQELKKRL